MNIKIIKGRLARDPEYTRKEEENKSFTKWTVATDRRYGDGTDYHDCIIFGKRAAVIEKYFRKGSEIACYGEEHIEPYTGKDGIKRKSATLFVDQFDFCGSKNDSSKGKNNSGDSWNQFDEDNPF